MAIQDYRSSQRFLTEPPLHAVVGRVDVSICNVGVQGIQIEHADPLAPNHECTLAFILPQSREVIHVTGVVMWSEMFRRDGKYLYRSGLRIDSSAGTALRPALENLLDAGLARPDTDSLERKKLAIQKKSTQVAGQMFVRPATPNASNEEVERIQEAARRLLSTPDEIARWSAVGQAHLSGGLASASPTGPGDLMLVLAVWEYLDRASELRTIASVLQRASIERR
ncbi:MAG TPA: hypothetical protein VNM92_15555 [Thermoanaerobaculia bacterium]|nr:hypothetical protein [Thermoanaerobaculia bacterium]